VALAVRHPVVVAVAFAGAAALAGVLVFAQVRYALESDRGPIDLAAQEQVSPAALRTAFAAQGIHLPHAYAFVHGTVLSDLPPAEHGRGSPVLVTVGGRTGRVDYGPVLTRYDGRFENVLVTYDGPDAALVERLGVAVAALVR
jgi:hypothetical protein